MAPHDKCLFGKDEVLERLRDLRARGRDIRADFALACLIADNALLRQRDRGGADYSHHTTRVAQHNAPDNILMIIGKLHDVVEDSDWTLDDLRAAGFSARIVAAVDALTHREGELYFDSIERVARNTDARAVKLADLKDNMSVSRMAVAPGPADIVRLQRYVVSFQYLSALQDGSIPADTDMRRFIALRPALDQGPAFWAQHSARPYGAPAPRHPAP